MASPAYRASTNVAGSAAANLTLTKPTGTVDNDILIAVIGKDDNVDPTAPTGWTLLASGKPVAANACYIYWKRAASEGASWVWTFASVWREGVVLAYSGVPTTGNPYDPDPLAAIVTNASSAGLATNDNTTLTADTTSVIIHSNETGNTWSAAPTGYTRRVTSFGGTTGEVCVNDKAFVGPGAVGTATQSNIQAGGATAFMFVLRSVAAGSATLPPGQSTLDSKMPVKRLWRGMREADVDASEFWLLKDKQFGVVGQTKTYDWPNPRGYVPNITLKTWTNSYTLGLIGKDTFFGAPGMAPDYDYPNPRGYVPNITLKSHIWNPLQTLLNVIVAANPFAQLSWPNPMTKFWEAGVRTWRQDKLTNVLAGQDQFFGAAGQPPANLDWPNPRGVVPPIGQKTWIWTTIKFLGLDTFFGAAGQPPPNADWPNPQVPTRPIMQRTWLVNLLSNTLAQVITIFPFNLLDWPVTLGKTPNPSLKTHIDPLKTNLIGQDMFFGLAGQPPANLDWPVPQPPVRPIGQRTWIQNLLQNTLAPAAVAAGANLILVGGRLAIKVKGIIYEFLD